MKLNVTLGVVDISNGPHTWTTLVDDDDIIIHENYTSNSEFAANDVALLRIRKTMLLGSKFVASRWHFSTFFVHFSHFFSNFREFSTGKVLPIRLPSRDDSNTFEGEIGTLSGWGFRDTRQLNDPNVLYYINEAVLSNEECTLQNKNPTYPPIVESEICISTEYGKTACPGENFKLFNEFL